MTNAPQGSVPAPADPVELARAFIRTPSPNPPGDERRIAGVVADAARSLGLPAPRVLARDDRRPNLAISLDFGSGGRHLVLSGHLDTKPVGDATWAVEPLGAEIDGDRLYGLGAADMKGAIAAMLVAAARAAATGPAGGRLTLLFTADEEDGAGFGAHFLAETGAVAADAVVIGEPGGLESDFDALHLVSRGIARFRITATARQGHSSLSDLGGRDPAAGNAGVAVARAVTAVAAGVPLRVPENAHRLRGWHPTVNTGLIYRGGVGYGVLPGRISVDTEVRLVPGMDRDDVLAAFRTAVQAAAVGDRARLAVEFDEPPQDWLEATVVAPDDPIAHAAREACHRCLGRIPPDSVFPGTTDATWFGGLSGIPTLPALGPGLLRRAHGADEWVSVDAVRTAAELYTRLIHQFCPAATGEPA